ncbi:cadmium-translocating P-type ATPase [Planctopirus hydrillae]|uniref:P-type Zn(2+) transporter n=2 Tax=Planctopirus hydrillae TaxID=1841610 RepID=A0A1C3E7F9_9PLAN|nr:cadmium-translocating P-type ATPase [Planctopirus hydrillae]
MDCMDEVAILRRAVVPVVGSDDRLSFDVLSRRMTVDISGTTVASSAVMEAVAQTGMRAEVWSEGDDRVDSSAWNRGLVWTGLSGGFLLVALLIQAAVAWRLVWGLPFEVIEWTVLAASILCGLWLVAPKAIRAARSLRPDMNLLMTVAVIGAVIIGEYVEAASVAFLFALAESLEAWSIRRAHRAITALLDLSPPTARLIKSDGNEDVRPIADVPVRSHIIVKPGERIPLDGTVVAGTSHVNQAPITGESLPVGKQVGDAVFAGTVNGNGALEVETTKAADDTTVAHIVRLVEEAQTRRSPSEQWVERFARYYTPTVMAAALVVFLVPPLVLGQVWNDWLYRSLVLLVIACPCALVISTPVSIVAALAAAARQGVLIKGGVYVEAPSRLQAVALDKTGTLTEGRPSVRAVIPLDGHTETELLERVAALEARSEHPLAQAILAHARSASVSIRPAEEYQEIPGKGASGRWNGEMYWLGSVRLLQERGQQTPEVQQQIAHLADQGQTVVVVGNQRHICGLLALADTVRPTAKAAISELKAAGVRHVIMLTGDTATTAEAIGREVGVDEIRAELLPAEKVQVVEKLVQEYKSVAMVGDGVNDAPALATASLGVAMGVAGSDAAIETADIALMSNDLSKLPWVVRLSRRTLRIIKQNIWFSLLVKAAFVVLTFVGYSTLWGAIAADTGASLLVIFNGLRLLRH